MTDDITPPTPEEKQAAADVLANPDYVPEADDTPDTIDDPVTEETE
jgi:hypothetical protein